MIDSKLVNVYVQVRTIKGNRYLDVAGEIMNRFEEEFPTQVIQADNLGGTTLSMIKPDGPLRHVRVTTQVVWLHFETPDTNQFVVDHTTRIVDSISDKIGVTHYGRVGVRTQHIAFDDDPGALIQRARRYFFSPALDAIFQATEHRADDGLDTFQLIYPVRVGDMSVNFQAGSAEQAPDNRETFLPRRGVLLDTDMFREGQATRGEVRSFLRTAMAWVEGPVSRMIGEL